MKGSHAKVWVDPLVDLPLFTTATCPELLECTRSEAHDFKEEWARSGCGGGGGADLRCRQTPRS